jgi:xylose isomerase
MRTYLILKEKARRFALDSEIAAALADSSVDELARPSVGRYSPEDAAALRAAPGDPNTLAGRGYHNERLDQLVMELLLGVR